MHEDSTRRLAEFLDAAADLFVDFPDKRSIASALLNQYGQEIEAHWNRLETVLKGYIS